jgi:serine O-acetyltransferase
VDSLTQDFDAHVLFTFAEIPDEPPLANRWARLKRWFTIAFVESWLAIFLFRLKKRLRAAGVPFLPGLCDTISRVAFGVQIGDQVEVDRGLMITHGNVVIDGRVRIGRRCQLNPWVTIGLSNSRKLGFSVEGPTIGNNVHVGTGAKIIGPVTVGDYARIGANAVVVHDVPPNCTVVGVPARVVVRRPPPEAVAPETEESTAPEDVPLLDHMRSAIVDYRLERQSLRSLVDTLVESFESGSAALEAVHGELRDHLVFLDAVAAAGGDETDGVRESIAAIQAMIEQQSAVLAHPPLR